MLTASLVSGRPSWSNVARCKSPRGRHGERGVDVDEPAADLLESLASGFSFSVLVGLSGADLPFLARFIVVSCRAAGVGCLVFDRANVASGPLEATDREVHSDLVLHVRGVRLGDADRCARPDATAVRSRERCGLDAEAAGKGTAGDHGLLHLHGAGHDRLRSEARPQGG